MDLTSSAAAAGHAAEPTAGDGGRTRCDLAQRAAVEALDEGVDAGPNRKKQSTRADGPRGWPLALGFMSPRMWRSLSVGLIAAIVTVAGGAGAKEPAQDQGTALVVSADAGLRKSPRSDSHVLEDVNRGSWVWYFGRIKNDHFFVVAPSGTKGWMSKDVLHFMSHRVDSDLVVRRDPDETSSSVAALRAGEFIGKPDPKRSEHGYELIVTESGIMGWIPLGKSSYYCERR
jgi:hypothetical protein